MWRDVGIRLPHGGRVEQDTTEPWRVRWTLGIPTGLARPLELTWDGHGLRYRGGPAPLPFTREVARLLEVAAVVDRGFPFTREVARLLEVAAVTDRERLARDRSRLTVWLPRRGDYDRTLEVEVRWPEWSDDEPDLLRVDVLEEDGQLTRASLTRAERNALEQMVRDEQREVCCA